MMKLNVTVILLCLIVTSCKDDYITPIFTKSDFPVTVGSYWIYQCHDYHIDLEYNVTHKIEWAETLNADTQIIHYTLYSPNQSVRDSAIGILTNSGFTYLGVKQTNYSVLGDFRIDFPFSKNDKWVGVNQNDTLQVVLHADKFAVSANTYEAVFYLYNYYRKSLNVRENEIYLSKGVGIITKNLRKENGNSQLDEVRSYTLLDYHIE